MSYNNGNFSVRDKWNKITDFTKDPTYRQENPEAGNTKTMECIEALEKGEPLPCDTEVCHIILNRPEFCFQIQAHVFTECEES